MSREKTLTLENQYSISLLSTRYKAVKENIAAKYAELESQLVDAFIDAQRSLDTKRMRQYAQVLSPFPLVSADSSTTTHTYPSLPLSPPLPPSLPPPSLPPSSLALYRAIRRS